MPKRFYLFLFVTAFIAFTLSLPSLMFASEANDERSLEITYIGYVVNDGTVLIALEGVATGYLDMPELIFEVNQELRPVSFEYFSCLGNAENICWETSYTSEPYFWGAHYDLAVIDPTNEVMDTAELTFFPGEPVQCSAACGKLGDEVSWED